MKNIFLAALTLLLCPGSHSLACNTCGCSASTQYFGILPDLPGHFIGLQYTYRWYQSYHDATEPNKSPGHEYYQAAQVWGRYSLSQRVQLIAVIPYQTNLKIEDGARSRLQGIGDATILANVVLMRPSCDSTSWRQYLQGGAGLKAPTGAYNNSVLGSGDALAPSMQAGTGSWDFVANTSYTLQHGVTGVNADATAALTTANGQQYKYGNRVSAGLQAFREWKRKDTWRILPAIGMRYDWSAQDFDYYPTRERAAYTGGYMLYATAGLRCYSHHWGTELAYYKPVAQHYADDLVQSRGKTQAGVVYLF